MNVPSLDNAVGLAGVVDEASLVSKAAGIDVDVIFQFHHIKLPLGDIGKISLFTFVCSQLEDLADVFDDEVAGFDKFRRPQTESSDGLSIEDLQALLGAMARPTIRAILPPKEDAIILMAFDIQLPVDACYSAVILATTLVVIDLPSADKLLLLIEGCPALSLQLHIPADFGIARVQTYG